MKCLFSAAVLGSPVIAVVLAGSPAVGAQAEACSFSRGLTTCVATSATQAWRYVDYESGSSNDGTLTALWCQQQSPADVLNQYETFETYFLVRSTHTTTTVRRGRHGPTLSVTTSDTRRVLRYTMPRDPGQEPSPGDALTCSYEAS